MDQPTDMNQARAIIFDLDGTLIDSLPDITTALNRALEEIGLCAVTTRDVRKWIGDGIHVLCSRAIEHVRGDASVERLAGRLQTLYESDCVVETRCYPNVLKMLDLLKERSVPCAMLTNKPHVVAMRIIDALDLRRRLVAARGYVGESDKKPSPKQALALADALNIEPSNVMIVGDSIVDIATARNAGMIACAVSWGYQEKSELVSNGPDFVIDEPLAIEKLLERI